MFKLMMHIALVSMIAFFQMHAYAQNIFNFGSKNTASPTNNATGTGNQVMTPAEFKSQVDSLSKETDAKLQNQLNEIIGTRGTIPAADATNTTPLGIRPDNSNNTGPAGLPPDNAAAGYSSSSTPNNSARPQNTQPAPNVTNQPAFAKPAAPMPPPATNQPAQGANQGQVYTGFGSGTPPAPAPRGNSSGNNGNSGNSRLNIQY